MIPEFPPSQGCLAGLDRNWWSEGLFQQERFVVLLSDTKQIFVLFVLKTGKILVGAGQFTL